MKTLVNKLTCAGDNITEKDLLIRTLNRLGPGYLDLASIITANKMNFDDAYVLLLTHEARLEQNQNPQAMFNANYSMVNANYANSSHVRGFPGKILLLMVLMVNMEEKVSTLVVACSLLLILEVFQLVIVLFVVLVEEMLLQVLAEISFNIFTDHHTS